MSEENVEIVRQHMVAFESGDYEAALAAYHPDVVCDATVRPEGRAYQGREGVAEAIRVWADVLGLHPPGRSDRPRDS